MTWRVRRAVFGMVLGAALAGCAQTSRIGPYVRHVSRSGDHLVIHKCVIVLTDKDLYEEGCTTEHIPLASLPVAPAGPPGASPPHP